ncbi:ImmA/IrrE family metallo-endopeptidase [Comamonas sp. AG1104]|uniref:ImmA/IrrE family metallo-endopeptidase n=1 Tax=Comamonas sp. AG1104 TaxID=2183900 RepID=UPI000E0C294C|nr:ImmA/IrrE family metallo-endopeptidase [Comamonas sp. AG1104]
MGHPGFIVPPRRKEDICKLATSVRGVFGQLISGEGKLPIGVVYELLPDLLPGFEMEVKEPWEMGEDHGQTYPDKRRIYLRRDVYDGMCMGRGRDRFTGAHELGHLFLHTRIGFARAMTSSTKIYCNSEWQANTFASALLIDEVHLKDCRSLEEVMERFGVSRDAASVRFRE